MAKPKNTVTARLLVATVLGDITYPCNTLISADKSVIDGLRRDGAADASPKAVAYCVDQGIVPVALNIDASVPDTADDADPAAALSQKTTTDPDPTASATDGAA